MGRFFQRPFLFHRHVIAEQHDVFSRLQRCRRFLRRVLSGNRDQADLILLSRLFYLIPASDGFPVSGPRAGLLSASDGLLHGFHNSRSRPFLFCIHNDHHIVGLRLFQPVRTKASFSHDLQIGRGPHHHRGFLHPRKISDLPAQHHQLHRVHIAVFVYDCVKHFKPPPVRFVSQNSTEPANISTTAI